MRKCLDCEAPLSPTERLWCRSCMEICLANAQMQQAITGSLEEIKPIPRVWTWVRRKVMT